MGKGKSQVTSHPMSLFVLGNYVRFGSQMWDLKKSRSVGSLFYFLIVLIEHLDFVSHAELGSHR